MAHPLLYLASMNRRLTPAVLLFASAAWPGRALAQGDWTIVRTDRDGLTVESRTVPESGMPELRVSVVTPSPPSALTAAAWELRKTGMQSLYLARRDVLFDSADLRLLFFEVRPPIIDPRQCILRQWRWTESLTGAVHLRFHSVPFRPTPGEAQPFAQLRGEWTFHPHPGGGSRLVYVNLVDVGGIPAWLARGPQLDATVDTVREVVARALFFTPGKEPAP